MKGYIASSENYITVKEIKLHINRFKKEQKESQEQWKKKQERKENLIMDLIQEEKQERKREEQRRLELSQIKDQILISIRKQNPFPYRQFLIAWDILMNNYYQIYSDLYNQNITKDDIFIVVNYIEKISDRVLDEAFKEWLFNLTQVIK